MEQLRQEVERVKLQNDALQRRVLLADKEATDARTRADGEMREVVAQLKASNSKVCAMFVGERKKIWDRLKNCETSCGFKRRLFRVLRRR